MKHVVLRERPRYFVFGVNLPWLDGNYDHDLGANHLYHPRRNCTYNFDRMTHLEAYFTHISQAGFKVVRFWVFEKLEGLKLAMRARSDGTKFRVIAIDQDMKDNVQDVMRKAASAGLKLYWCILAGTWIQRACVHEPPPERCACAGCAHYFALKDLFTVDETTDSFIDNALKKFLDWIAPHRNHVFAIDLINEPEGLDRCKTAKWNHITKYIEKAARACHEKGFDCSVGFQKPKTIREHASSIKDLDFYDFHVYEDPPTIIERIKKVRENGFDKPCIIGEFGQDNETNNDRLRDNIQKKADGELMEKAWEFGYHGCLVWYYNWFGYDPTAKKNDKLEVKHSLLDSKLTPLERSTFEQDFNLLTHVEKVSKLKEIERPVWDEIRKFAQKNQPVPPPFANAWHVPS